MRSPGTTISAVGHVGLIGWMLLGWGMNAAPLPVEVMDVSLISGEEFEELIAASTPEPGLAPPDTPPPPPVVETPPPPPPVVETPPAPPPPPPPPPPPVADAPPSDTPSPPVADRIAAVPTPPPPPDAEIADTVRDAVVPDPATSAPVAVPEQAATALPETATEIAIADEAPSGAVERSIRPVPRPVRAPDPEPVAEATPDVAPEPAPVPDTSADVAAALAAALTEAPAVPQGPPMTGAERDSFRIAVNRCWNVDPGSVAARVIVEVGFTLTRDGMVDGQPRLISSDGDAAATDTAFEAARRAILRCQSGGYQLPADKYDQWREVVITFDPSGMRLR